MSTEHDLLRLTANTVRGLAMDAVQKANSGHPGMPMGMADVAAVLWLEHLRWVPDDPSWPGRDRFVLSAGHGSMLLYSLLHLCGYDLPMAELRRFRQLHSHTPGHPEVGDTPGVETTTGPLGQGFANGVGLALAGRMAAARFAHPGLAGRVFAIVSDGDLMEGISAEAASLAGHLGLSDLVYLYDDNRITIEGETSLAFSEDVGARFTALGWHTEHADGHDFDSVRKALAGALAQSDQPSLIVCRTHIAQGSPNKVDTAEAHGAPLGADEIALAKQALGLPARDFWVPDEVKAAFAARAQANAKTRDAWLAAHRDWERADSMRAETYRRFRERVVPTDLLDQLLAAAGNAAGATRAHSGKIIQKAAELVPSLITGSADLDPSTKTRIKSSPSIRRGEYAGRNLHFGIREHAMGGMLNGLALYGGFLPAGSTFLVFSDYMRPSVRLAALMRLPVGFVYTHDSLMVGEDGPTHQPVEQLAALRLIPNLHVFRPADAPETAAAWTHALRRRTGPVALALTRQNLPALSRPVDFDNADLLRGGYVLRDAPSPQAVVVATGAEVGLAVAAADLLAGDHELRIVSMPCLELFLEQDPDYCQGVLPDDVPVFVIEMGRPEPWCALTGSLERVIGLNRFGASAPAEDLAAHVGFAPEPIAKRLREMIPGALRSPARRG
jgi:transketolase